jgi:hydroxymethylpyrimidine pyrophosphatase-like HAD family hydrolase
MRYRALATDYDGTLAHDGQVDEITIAALHRAREAGLLLLLVTGRELNDLAATFAHMDLFDGVVVENGAVLYDPPRRATRVIAQAPPPDLLRLLQEQNIPLSVGHSIVATVEPHEHAVLDAIRKLGLEWHVIFNKGAVMALPSSVTKATGFACALKDLNTTAEETIGIGDAQNDQAFLRMCGLAVAVANALPSVKAQADLVTAGARGAGVTELIDRLLSGALSDVSPRPEHHDATPTSPAMARNADPTRV